MTVLRENTPISYLSMGQLIEYALVQMADGRVTDQLDRILEEIRALKAPAAVASPAGRGRPRTKPTEEDREIEGISLCELLGGEVRGQMCVYKRYELTPASICVETEFGEPYLNLTEEDVAKQYDPSRAEYESARILQERNA